MGATIDSDDGAMIVMPSGLPAIKAFPIVVIILLEVVLLIVVVTLVILMM